MHRVYTSRMIDGRLKKGQTVILINPDGRVIIKGYQIFYKMKIVPSITDNKLFWTVGTTIEENKGKTIIEEIIFEQVDLSVGKRIKVTIGNKPPIYCDPFEFTTEIADSFIGSIVS